MVYFPLKSEVYRTGLFYRPPSGRVCSNVTLKLGGCFCPLQISDSQLRSGSSVALTSNNILRYQYQLIVAIAILLFFFRLASPSKKSHKTTKKYCKVLSCKQFFNNCTKRKFKSILTGWECEWYILWFALLVIDFKGKAVPKCWAATCPYHRDVLLEQTGITEKHSTNCKFQKKKLQ